LGDDDSDDDVGIYDAIENDAGDDDSETENSRQMNIV